MATTTSVTSPMTGDNPSQQADRDHRIITVTMNEIPGFRIVRVLGIVTGLTVRSRNWGTDIGAFLRSAVGGELKWLTTLVYKARDSAIERMTDDCIARGGNAIIAMRFETAEIGLYVQTSAYGTACIIQEIDPKPVEAKDQD